MMETKLGLYVHVPFCRSKCPYCDFYSVRADEASMDAYTDAVLNCMDRMAERYRRSARTLYFGGGTPSLLGTARLARLVERARMRFGLEGAEITIEANPGAAQLELFAGLRAAGVNRLSMGLQSASDIELAHLGRHHTAADARLAVEHARHAGFANISLDLMLGIPGQTAESLTQSVQFCADLGVEHISAYLLKVEPDTPFGRDASLREGCADDDLQADLYLQAVEELADLQYNQYEISNFSRTGYESKHNCLYWESGEYLGMGPSAHGFVEGKRYFYPRGVDAFVRAAREGLLLEQMQPENDDDIPAGGFVEYAMLRLRLVDGLRFADAAERYPEEDFAGIAERAKPFARAGLLRLSPERIALTASGFLLSNTITVALLLG